MRSTKSNYYIALTDIQQNITFFNCKICLSIKDDQILFLAAEHIEGRTGMIYIGQSYIITEFLNQFHKNIREVLKKILAIDNKF